MVSTPLDVLAVSVATAASAADAVSADDIAA